jgi:hypothetical protein
MSSDTYPSFIDCVMELWDKKFDTYDIAKMLEEHESSVSRALCHGREQRRASK